MSEVFENFKTLFISKKNSSYIINIVKNKFDDNPNNLSEDNYLENLLEIQNYIFNNYFEKIYNDLKKSKNFNFENLLISLNKLSITNLEYLVTMKLNNTDNKMHIKTSFSPNDTNTSNEIVNVNVNVNTNTNTNNNTNTNSVLDDNLEFEHQKKLIQRNEDDIIISNTVQDDKENIIQNNNIIFEQEKREKRGRPKKRLNTLPSIFEDKQLILESKNEESSDNLNSDYTNTNTNTNNTNNTNTNNSNTNNTNTNNSNTNTKEILDIIVKMEKHIIKQNDTINYQNELFEKILKVSENSDKKQTEYIQKLENLNKNLIKAKGNTSTSIHNYYHFFSGDCVFSNDKYNFKFALSNLHGVSFDKLKLECHNFLNIDNDNNILRIFENDLEILINIHPGYYKSDELLSHIEKELNNKSQNNKRCYKVYKNNQTNSVYFLCKNTSGEPQDFSIKFPENNVSNFPLHSLLGFTNPEYMGGSMYISENPTIENIYDEIYVKLYINDKEVTKVLSSDNEFSYFVSLDLDLNKYFGKKYIHKFDVTDEYILNENTDVKMVSFEFLDSSLNPLQIPINFEVTMSMQIE